MISGNRGNHILELKRCPSAIEKSVSLPRREPFFNLTRRPLYLQTMVFTPPLHSERGWGRGFPLFANATVLYIVYAYLTKMGG